MTSDIRLIGYGVLALAAIVLAGKGAETLRKARQFDNVQAQVQQYEHAASVGDETADRVSREAYRAMQQAAQDSEAIHARIRANPTSAGRADADILRIAEAAHARAVNAAGRVSGTGGGDDPASAPGKR